MPGCRLRFAWVGLAPTGGLIEVSGYIPTSYPTGSPAATLQMPTQQLRRRSWSIGGAYARQSDRACWSVRHERSFEGDSGAESTTYSRSVVRVGVLYHYRPRSIMPATISGAELLKPSRCSFQGPAAKAEHCIREAGRPVVDGSAHDTMAVVRNAIQSRPWYFCDEAVTAQLTD